MSKSHIRPNLILILILTLVGASVAGSTIYLLYLTAFDVQRDRMAVLARSEARMIQGVVEHEYSEKTPDEARAAVAAQIGWLLEGNQAFGKTGEFLIGRRDNDLIQLFFVNSRRSGMPNPAPLDSPWAGPMRLALNGKSGGVVGTDNRGQRVLSVYEPVPGRAYGVVTKIDLAEIRQPFVWAATFTGLLTLVIILGAPITFTRITGPMIRRLRESEAQLRTILANAPIVLWALDRNGLFTLSEGKGLGALGLKPGEVVGQSVFQFYKDSPDIIADTRRALAGENISSMLEVAGLAFDTRYSPLRDSAGEIIGIIGLAVDVTERTRAEAELRSSQKQLQDVVDAIPHTINTKDIDGRYLLVNRAFADFNNMKSTDMIGKRRDELPSGTTAEVEIRLVADRRVIETGEMIEIPEAPLTRNDGTARISRIQKIPLHDENGSVTKLLTVGEDITERKRAEAELRAKQKFLQDVIDAVPHDINVKDIEGKYMLTNRTNADRYHVNPEDMIGKRRSDFAVGTTAEINFRAETDRRVVETGERIEIPETPLTLRDGTTQIRRILKVPLFDDENRVTAVIASSEDITARKQAETALRESEAKFRDLVEGSIQGVIISQDRTIKFANQAFAEMVGYHSAAEVLNMKNWEFVAPHDRERVGAYGPDRYAGRVVPRRYDYDGMRRDGSFVRLERLVQLTLWQGRPALQITIIDISERRRAEEELRRSQRLLQAVFDAVPFGIGVKDLEGRYLMVNKETAKIRGLAPEEEVGRTTMELPGVSEEEKAVILAGDREVIETGRMVVQTQVPVTYADGTAHLRNFFKVPLYDEEQRVTAVVGVGEDITERKAIEDQLRQAQKMEAIGHLTGGVAHDFNNLLQVVLGNLEMLVEYLHGDEQPSRWAQRAIGAAKRGAGLTHHLLAYSRKQKLDGESTDLNQIIAEFNQLLHRTLGGAIQVVTHYSESLGQTFLDPNQVQTALLNLSLNARDAMPNGGKLTFKTANRVFDEAYARSHPGVAPGEYAMVEVTDTGTGIPADLLDRVWDPFFTTKDVGQGSGLGLSMVFGFVKQSGGHIEIDSEAGQGTTVRLYFPRVAGNSLPLAAGEAAAADANLKGQGRIVLVVEDDEEVRTFATDVLALMGFKVLQAGDAAGALELLGGIAQVDLMLTDIVMPGGLSGLDLATRARALRPDLKVVLTSGYADESVVRSLASQDDVAFLPKPYARADLIRTFRRMLAGAKTPG